MSRAVIAARRLTWRRARHRPSARPPRAIFDRYNIIHEQELLDAGDQLVAYLAQQAQAPRGRAHPTGAAVTRTAPALRLVRRTTA